jgi:MFS transporter, putative metabolite:H+ symporter
MTSSIDRIASETSEFRPFHAWITALAGLAFLGNGLDLALVSFSLTGMRAELDLSAAEVGYILPMSGIGQLAGSFLAGWLSDRIGRRLAFVLSGALAGLTIGLAAASPNPLVFAILLLIAGLGFGGVAPAASALLSELAPPTHRGRMMAWTQVFWVGGWAIAATLGGWFSDMLGWRGILLFGTLPAALALLCWFVVPESPRYLASRGRDDRARALAERLATRHGVHIPLVYGTAGSRARTSVRSQFARIWSPALWRRTFALWATWTAMNAAFSGPISMMPVVLERLGAADPLRLSAYVGYAMAPASLVSVFFIDRSGRRPLMVGSLLLAALGALTVALGSQPTIVVVGGAVLAAGALAAWPVALAWASELYPTSIRGTAAGWAAGFSRLGSISAPLIIGQLLLLTGSHTIALLPFALALFTAVACVAVFASETANEDLEALTQSTAPAVPVSSDRGT